MRPRNWEHEMTGEERCRQQADTLRKQLACLRLKTEQDREKARRLAAGYLREIAAAREDDAHTEAHLTEALISQRRAEARLAAVVDALKEIREACCSGEGGLPAADIERAETALRAAEGKP